MQAVSDDRLRALLAQPPSAAAFAQIVQLLDERPERGDAASAMGAAALEAWPDETRAAPEEAWQRVQEDDVPWWWTLVRHVRVRHRDTLDVGGALDPLTSIDASHVEVDPAPLANARRLRALNLAGNNSFLDLQFLSGALSLEELDLSHLELLPDLDPLAALPALWKLDIRFNHSLEDITALVRATSLRHLDVSGSSYLSELEPIATMASLETLLMDRCARLRDLSFLAPLNKLRRLVVLGPNRVSDLAPLQGLRLESLHIGGKEIIDADPIGEIDTLIRLALDDLPLLGDLSFLRRLHKIRRLSVVGCGGTLPQLDAPDLEHLLVGECPEVADVAGIAGLRSVHTLLLDTLPISNISPLAHLTRLDSLSLRRCRRINDLSPLTRLPLRFVDLTGCDPSLDLTPLPAGCRVER
jgi:Leucine-rich repeat (LRR) protein